MNNNRQVKILSGVLDKDLVVLAGLKAFMINLDKVVEEVVKEWVIYLKSLKSFLEDKEVKKEDNEAVKPLKKGKTSC
jgi:hypothetical protein